MILLCESSTWLVVIEVEGLVYKVCLILKKEKSPYLKQHEDNPVDWYAWNKETLLKAKMFWSALVLVKWDHENLLLILGTINNMELETGLQLTL